MAEEFDFHLLKLARAECEIPRSDLVAKTLADLCDPEGDFHPGAVDHVLEVDEDPLGGLRAEEGGVFLAAQGTNDRLEHQVEFPRLGEGAQGFGVGGKHLRGVVDAGQRHGRSAPLEIALMLRSQLEEF